MLILFIVIGQAMAESEQIALKRREKILARLQKEQKQQIHKAEQQGKDDNVYDRYKMIKLRQKTQKDLLLISRLSGLVILALSYIWPPWVAFLVVDSFLIAGAVLLLSGQKQSKDDSWIAKRVPFLDKLKHLKLIILTLKLLVNSIFSFILVVVLFNASLVHISSRPYDSSQVPSIQIPSIDISSGQPFSQPLQIQLAKGGVQIQL